MALMVKHNLAAINTLNQLNKNDSALQKDVQRLSSGMKINGAADDASGYAIADKMDVQVRSLGQNEQNTQNGKSLLQTAEGAIDSTVSILRTLKEKVINAANDTNTDVDRQTIQKALDQAVDQLDDNANVQYNGEPLMNGSHNSKVLYPGTYTTFSNSSLAVDTNTQFTPLIKLCQRSGGSLGIQIGDTISVSYVKGGKTIVSEPIEVKKRTALVDVFHNVQDVVSVANPADGAYLGQDQYGNKVYTPDHIPALTYCASQPGLNGQIAGLTFNVVGRDGQTNNLANGKLNNFEEVIHAQDPSEDNAIIIHSGARANQNVKVGLANMGSVALGLRANDGTVLNVCTQASANAAINALDNALKKALDQQTMLGSIEDRLGYTQDNIVTSKENTQASMSTIRDADMAHEYTEHAKHSILTQSAQAMLAQANQNSSSVLSLLQGQ